MHSIAAPLLIGMSVLAAGCVSNQEPVIEVDPVEQAREVYEAEVNQWHADRLRVLQSPDGWLTIVGLHWIEEGANGVGRRAEDEIRYSGFAADHVGTIDLRSGVLWFEPAPGVWVDGVPRDGVLRTDAGDDPTILTIANCTFHVIERGGRFGVRVKDRNAPLLREFDDIKRFPVDDAWRVTAVFEPAEPEEKQPLKLRTGAVLDEAVAGRARFSLGGMESRFTLLPGTEDGSMWLVFGDATNGEMTYAAGRFLRADLADDGSTLVLDFNRAYNPPCAFTPWATCPLPQPENVLPYPVTAGEMSWGGDH